MLLNLRGFVQTARLFRHQAHVSACEDGDLPDLPDIQQARGVPSPVRHADRWGRVDRKLLGLIN